MDQKNEHDYSSFNTELNLICKEIFEKCAFKTTMTNTSSSSTSSMLPNGESYVLCTDVINYINQGLTNNKLMSTNNESVLSDCTLNESTQNENNESIKYLKRLFSDHFKIDESQLDTSNDLKLDLNSLNSIFQKWIKKLSLNTSITNNVASSNDDLNNQLDQRITYKQHMKKDFKSNKELKNSLKRIRKLKLDSDETSLAVTSHDDNRSLAATSSSSSLPSVSLNSSDDDGLLLSMSKLNSERNSNSDLDNLELNDELMSENMRLKQNINDLKMQLANAEDLNSQMNQDIEQLNNRNLCLNKANYELVNKMNTVSDDNEQNTKLIEHLKTRVECLISENKSLNTDVKTFKNKCSSYENEIFNLKSQIEMNEFDKENLLMDLNDQKTLLNQLEAYNSKLEHNLFEAKSKCLEQEQEIDKLNQIIQDKRKENENLNEKNTILADKFKSSNTKLLRKNYFSLNESTSNNNNSKNNNKIKNRNMLSPSFTFTIDSSFSSQASKLANETQTESDEAESLMNIYIAANLNDNTFHLSPNEANFLSEQFEFQNKLEENMSETTTATKTTSTTPTKSDENIAEQFKLFLNKLDQIKLQYEELKKYDTLDSRNINCNLDLDKTYLGKSFKTMLDTFFGYLYDKNKNEINQNLEHMVNQSKKFKNVNKQLNEQFTSALKKIKLLQNQVYFYKSNTSTTLTTVKTLTKHNKKCKKLQTNSVNNCNNNNNAESCCCCSNESILTSNLINDSDWYKLKDQSEKKQKCYSVQNLVFESKLNKSTPNSTSKVTSMSIDCLNDNLTEQPNKNFSSSSNSSLNNDVNQLKSRMINKTLSEIIGCKSFSNFDANDADVDDDESRDEFKNKNSLTKQQQTSTARSNLAAKRYSSSCNQIRAKSTSDTNTANLLDANEDALLNLRCSTCQEMYQINLNGTKLRSILSLDLTLDSKNDPVVLTSSLISNQRDASTQTQTEPNLSLLKNKKHEHLMRHQLTRDSGIDSDHQTQFKNHLSLSTKLNKKQQQIILPINKCDEKTESEDNLRMDDYDEYDDKQSKEFLTSSTRDNSSVDIQNSSSLDDPDDLIIDLFKRNELSCPQDKTTKKSNEIASNKRLLFKNNKTTLSMMNASKRQLNFYSFQMPNDSVSPSPTTDKNFELDNNKLEKHSIQIESTKPMIHFTKISKLSDQLQNDRESTKLNVTIDDILNVVDEPVPVPNKTPIAVYRNRAQLRRNSSLSDNNSSINDDTIYTCYDQQHQHTDHKLKQLESNFNQIAMAHHSDELLVENNIELYRDKYKKANTYMDLLFDEITTSINKMLNLLINEQLDTTSSNDITYSTRANSTYESTDLNLSLMNTCRSQSTHKYKKLMQENLSLLNKTIERVRKNLICLVTTSSTISGLKQEAHLSELFKITISYVKELKRSLLNNSNKSNTTTISSRKERQMNQSNYKRSLTSYESLEISEKLEVDSNANKLEIESSRAINNNNNNNNNWFSTISLIKSFSTQSHSCRKRSRRSHNSTNTADYIDEKHCSKHDYYDDDNFSISDNLNLLKSASSYQTNNMPNEPNSNPDKQVDSLYDFNNESLKKINDKNELNSTHQKNKIDMKSSRLNDLNKKLKRAWQNSLTKYAYGKEICSELMNQIRKDSFKCLRVGISMFLLIISILFFFCALLQDEDVYEKMFNYFLNNVEIKNPTFAGRSF